MYSVNLMMRADSPAEKERLAGAFRQAMKLLQTSGRMVVADWQALQAGPRPPRLMMSRTETGVSVLDIMRGMDARRDVAHTLAGALKDVHE